MAPRYTDAFRRDAVRIPTNCGLTRPQVASDLGVGLSTLSKWVQKHQHDDLMFGPYQDIDKKNKQPRKAAVSNRMKRDLAIRALDMAWHYGGHPVYQMDRGSRF